jgi:hypothetical protein
LGTDKGYDSGKFLQAQEERAVKPHVPLVKDPCDVDEVVHSKRKPGVEAPHCMKERQSTLGYLHKSQDALGAIGTLHRDRAV